MKEPASSPRTRANSDKPIDLSSKNYEAVHAFFDDATRALQSETGLSDNAVNFCFDAEFRMNFETASKQVPAAWKREVETWNDIQKAISKAIEKFDTLPKSSWHFHESEYSKLKELKTSATKSLEESNWFAAEVPSKRGNHQALVLAQAVGDAFQADNRKINYGRKPNSSAPSTDFGRAVETAFRLFRPEGSNGEIADWNRPAERVWKLITNREE